MYEVAKPCTLLRGDRRLLGSGRCGTHVISRAVVLLGLCSLFT